MLCGAKLRALCVIHLRTARGRMSDLKPETGRALSTIRDIPPNTFALCDRHPAASRTNQNKRTQRRYMTHPSATAPLTRCGSRPAQTGDRTEHRACLARGQLQQSSGSYRLRDIYNGLRASKGGFFSRVRKSAPGLLAAVLRIGRGTNGPGANGSTPKLEKNDPMFDSAYTHCREQLWKKVWGEGRGSFFRSGWLLPALIFKLSSTMQRGRAK